MEKKKSVLVVDDEPNGFDVIEAHLYREGYELFYAASGRDALDRLDTIEPDVILLDIMMPQMDGVEVCHIIKSDVYWKHIPIIMVTALTSKQDLARSLEAGADDFLTKPVSGIELRARVRSMLRIKEQYDALEATLHLREDLSKMIVHDLRNPLTNILLCSNLLLQDGFEGKNLERLKIIANSGRELNSMINDLLISAKMESGKMVLNRVKSDLKQLVAVVTSQFEAIAAGKNIKLVTQLPDESRWVPIDTNLFHRVVDNLISNALKFSPSNSTIVLQVDYPEDSTDSCTASSQAILRVIDSGPGIREDQRQRIFEKYEVGNVITGVSQLGLGLTFCKMVVEAHQGKILVEDNQPQGSIFTVIL
ncbi:MAG TPA: hybrid sensor histidine kinase/response regulator [Coleofasciculaceae cyanobacterium]